MPPRLGMAEYGLGNGFKGKAFIKIDGFIYKVLIVIQYWGLYFSDFNVIIL